MIGNASTFARVESFGSSVQAPKAGKRRPSLFHQTMVAAYPILFPGVCDYHLDFGLYNKEHGLRFTDHMELHLLELPKFQRPLDELHDPLDKWLYFFRHAEGLDPEQLPESLEEPVFRRAMEELKMLTQHQPERERYESRLKALRDEMSLIQEAREEGREQGREEGCHAGQFIGRIHLCERHLGRSLTPADQLLALPLETLVRRAEELENELFGS